MTDDAGGLWSRLWVLAVSLSVQPLPQTTEYNWIEHLLNVGLFLHKRVCSAEILLCPWLVIVVIFFRLWPQIWPWWGCMMQAFYIWSSRWVHYVYLKVARCGQAGGSWLSAFLFRNVCVLRLMFNLHSWLLPWDVISFGCALNFTLLRAGDGEGLCSRRWVLTVSLIVQRLPVQKDWR